MSKTVSSPEQEKARNASQHYLKQAFIPAGDLPQPETMMVWGTSSIDVPAESGEAASQIELPLKMLSDVALTNLFTLHIASINAGKQLIWQRYSVMLTGNSILLGFLGAGGGDKVPRVVVHSVGILLCVAWFVITWGGWAVSTRRLRIASAFKWQGLPDAANPASKEFARVVETGLWRDHIFLCAMLVIVLFTAAHAFLLLHPSH